MAIGNSPALAAIDERIELVNAKIDEVRENNQQTISLGCLSQFCSNSWK